MAVLVHPRFHLAYGSVFRLEGAALRSGSGTRKVGWGGLVNLLSFEQDKDYRCVALFLAEVVMFFVLMSTIFSLVDDRAENLTSGMLPLV